MASLVLVTREGRLFLKIGALVFGVLFILFLFVQGGALIKDTLFPKPPPLPVQAFGELPKVLFPEQTPHVIEYRINTINGELPMLPDRVNVYKIKENNPSLLALQEAKNTLDSANFVENQVKITDSLYRFTQSRTGVVIEYDIISKNFTLSSNYLADPTLVSTGILPSENSIKDDIQGFLRTISANDENIDYDNSKIEYLQEQNGGLVAAQNLGASRFARISLVQTKIDDMETVYGAPGGSILSFIVSYPSSNFRVLEGIFFNHEANLEEKSDYPIKTAELAFEDLKMGNAYVINPQNLTSVDITDVSLKYYLTKENQGYLLPVIEFAGVNFTAYVEAIPGVVKSSPSPQ